jgi:predicted RecA/RadA family phage recombinase
MENKELFAALVKAQAEMGNAPKDGKNPHFKNNYATLQSVIDTVRPVLSRHGLTFTQNFCETDMGSVAIETVIIHESGQRMGTGIFRVPTTKQDAQGYGSALTYCKRYSLQTAFGIASEDDDGNAACAPGNGNGKKSAPKPTEEQQKNSIAGEIWHLYQGKGMDKPAMLQSMSDFFGRTINGSADLSLTDAREFLEVTKNAQPA